MTAPPCTKAPSCTSPLESDASASSASTSTMLGQDTRLMELARDLNQKSSIWHLSRNYNAHVNLPRPEIHTLQMRRIQRHSHQQPADESSSRQGSHPAAKDKKHLFPVHRSGVQVHQRDAHTCTD